MSEALIRIEAFLCTWSHFMNEDIGTDARFEYAPDIGIQRVKCGGSIDPGVVIDAIIEGADGVYIGTCEPDTCRFTGKLQYQAGNKQANAKMYTLREALKIVGLEPERLRVDWLSPKRPERFPNFVQDFKVVVGGLGKVPRDEATLSKLKVMREVLSDFRVRWMFGKKLEITTDKNAFGEIVDAGRFKDLINDILRKDYIRTWLLKVLDEGPSTVEEMSERTGVPTQDVLRHLMRLRQKGKVAFSGDKDLSPVYVKEGV
jgi:coenzyme F420-reducing hydrogenase delta subunit